MVRALADLAPPPSSLEEYRPPGSGEVPEDWAQWEVTYQYVWIHYYGRKRAANHRSDKYASPWVFRPRYVVTPMNRKVRVIYQTAEMSGSMADIEYRPRNNKRDAPVQMRYWVRRRNRRYWSFLRALDADIDARLAPAPLPSPVVGIAAQTAARNEARRVALAIAQIKEPPVEEAGPVRVNEVWSDVLFDRAPPAAPPADDPTSTPDHTFSPTTPKEST